MGFVLGSVDDARLAQLGQDASNLPLSYSPIGSTQQVENNVAGFHVDRYHVEVSGTADVFGRAVEVLRRWEVHRGAGLRVAPLSAPIEPGVSVVVALDLPGLVAVAPCRIVWVVDEPDRFGFAYGTLKGHPESGEESFVATSTVRGVRFDIVGVSRPSALLARLGAPVSRRIQAATSRRYLSAFAARVGSS